MKKKYFIQFSFLEHFYFILIFILVFCIAHVNDLTANVFVFVFLNLTAIFPAGEAKKTQPE